MGFKLLILLGLLIGVLYCFHILAQDYQAITAPKLLKLLFKRDTSSLDKHEPSVRWSQILQHDRIQCARYLYCDLGARPPDNLLRSSFIYMLSLNTKEEDKTALEVFKAAYFEGTLEGCNRKYTSCPFQIDLLYELLGYIALNKYSVFNYFNSVSAK